MNICVIGTGYVGLVSGTCFADFGHTVICVDNNQEKIDRLNKGDVPIYEIGLDDLIRRNTKEKRLVFTTDLKKAVEGSLVIFIAVGTPAQEDGTANLDSVFAVAREIAGFINEYKVIVTKSTVPVGTGAKIKQCIDEVLERKVSPEYLNKNPEANSVKPKFAVISNPEFLREGSAIEDFMRPNRVVIGAESESAIAIMKDIYRPLYLFETPMIITSIETAELIKYASNAFLAAKISFINEMGHLCERLGANIDDLAKGMGLDKRIGSKFLHVSPGYGGSCFPKDTSALVHIAKAVDYDLKIVSTTIAVNDMQKEMMVAKVANVVGELKGKTIGILGLAFKPNTDDMRESASITIINGLQKKGAKIRAFDPAAMNEAKKILKNVIYCENAYDTIKDADALLLLTEWNEFRQLDLLKVKELLKQPLFIDLRNVYLPEKMKRMGFIYVSLGRST
ncbi:MAG: UDP-glucose/GDP-mannose dehydrogenase family protein [Candidatus Omnitrophica bacterium]|nr:UDP-glucose/GDP-mannose dehydrogenase family protein [Candidatus Omnitrophota bacterium]MBU4479062.1 UDP-glucose/GDP-mannose dehydrogenase family protein [Candidatus Omnitrophota bacterium]MCG2703095.1 UDP-glucose/GDP-mannose dehydrogenase family protein [Candidatus Omnitrophota bacterium]